MIGKKNVLVGIGYLIALILFLLTGGAGCGSYTAQEGNYTTPVMVSGCPQSNPQLPQDQRSLLAMIVAVHEERYSIYQVSPVEFKIFTEYKNLRRVVVGFEIQVYSDGSASIASPSTMPVQSAKALAYVNRYAQRLAQRFDRVKCYDGNWLQTRAAQFGYALQ